MKKKFSETQIINILKEGESGLGVTEICRKYGIVNSTYRQYTQHRHCHIGSIITHTELHTRHSQS